MNESDRQDNGKFKDLLHKINNLDFAPLAYKLMHPEDRPGLSFEQSLDAIKKYKGFLFLCHVNQGKSVSPSRYIDYVWHSHILDTELYLVQTGMLFGHFLHHFPFFGKRGAADETDLLAAADFTKRQASHYFGWDDDDWCGTGRKPHGPGPHSGLTDLLKVIFPAGLDGSGMNSNPDSVTIQAGNFRHTVEHVGFGADTLFTSGRSRQSALEKALKLPIWVTVCMPVDIGILNEISVIRNVEKLAEISRSLVEKRLTPDGYSGALVELQIGTQAERG